MAVALGVAVAFFLVAYFSLTFAKFAGRIATIWPANAVLLVMVLRNRRAAAMVLAAGLAGNLAANLLTGDLPAKALVLACLNAGEVGVCYLILRRAIRGAIDLSLPVQLATFVFGAAFVAPLISGALAAAYLAGGAPAGDLFWTWWISDALGLVIFTPALLVLSDRAQLAATFQQKGVGELTVLFGALLAALAVVFLQSRFPLLYVVPPILALLTFRLGLAGGATGVLLTAGVAILALILRHGPPMLAGPTDAVRVLTLQLFLAFVALTTLPLASVLGVRREFEQRIQAERDQAEHAAARLREANALADLAERMAGVGYWTHRASTGERTWSSEMYRIYGVDDRSPPLSLDEAIGRYHPEDRALVREALQEAQMTGEARQVNLRLQGAGQEQRVIACMQLVGGGGQSPDTLLGVLIDVTRLARAENALAVSEARHRELADLLPDLILRMSRDGRITYASPAAADYGYAPGELIGRDLHDLIHPDDAEQAKLRWGRYISPEGIDPALRREQRITTRGGEWVWLEGNPAQVRDPSGRVVEVIKVFRDMTQRRALEDALTSAREQAERALTIKTEFLANMSHELRTPLTAIIGFSTVMRATSQLPPREANFAARIENASKTLLALVNDILDLSKLEAGGFEFEAEPVAVADLVASSLALVTPQAQLKGLAVESRIEDIESFRGDAMRVRQVLVNLLGNAVKFTQRGGVTLTVGRDGDLARFSVADTGEGVSEEQLQKIFERFTQADGSSVRQYGGTGLGLAIARGLVEGMGGRLWVESRPNEGSVFHFTLPITPAAD